VGGFVFPRESWTCAGTIPIVASQTEVVDSSLPPTFAWSTRLLKRRSRDSEGILRTTGLVRLKIAFSMNRAKALSNPRHDWFRLTAQQQYAATGNNCNLFAAPRVQRRCAVPPREQARPGRALLGEPGVRWSDGPSAMVAGVTYPKPTDKIRLKLNIAGVQFTPNNPQAAGWTETRELDLRNIVLVVRFTQYLKDNWGASMSLGRVRDRWRRNSNADTHTEGLAMDFHGAVTTAGHPMSSATGEPNAFRSLSAGTSRAGGRVPQQDKLPPAADPLTWLSSCSAPRDRPASSQTFTRT
jgi:hypothetical protein